MKDVKGVDPKIGEIYSEKDSIYHSESDKDNEEKLYKFLEVKWDCAFHRFPRLHPIDFFTSRNGRLQSYVELKCKNKRINDFINAWVPVHQWETLIRHERYFGVPGIFVIAFPDNNVCWIRAKDVNMTKEMEGSELFVDEENGEVVFLADKNTERNLDRKCRKYSRIWQFTPTIEVPIKEMHRIDAGENGGLNLKF